MLASNSPIQNESNSQSGNLGASISDLSSEPPSELSDRDYNQMDNSTSTNQFKNSSLNNSVTSKNVVHKQSPNSGTSTPTKPYSSSSYGANSRLPVPKK